MGKNVNLPDGGGGGPQASTANHSHKTQSVPHVRHLGCFCYLIVMYSEGWLKILSDTDQQTKLVKVGGDTVRHEAELSNATVELDRPAMDNYLGHRLHESI